MFVHMSFYLFFTVYGCFLLLKFLNPLHVILDLSYLIPTVCVGQPLNIIQDMFVSTAFEK